MIVASEHLNSPASIATPPCTVDKVQWVMMSLNNAEIVQTTSTSDFNPGSTSRGTASSSYCTPPMDEDGRIMLGAVRAIGSSVWDVFTPANIVRDSQSPVQQK